MLEIYEAKDIEVLNCLRLRLKHSNEYKFQHSFKGTVRPVCNCNTSIETTNYFSLHCYFRNSATQKLFSAIYNLDFGLWGGAISRYTIQRFEHDSCINKLTFLYYAEKIMQLENDILWNGQLSWCSMQTLKILHGIT